MRDCHVFCARNSKWGEGEEESGCCFENLSLYISFCRSEVEEEGSTVHLPEPLDRGSTSPSLCEDEKSSPKKRQRLQEGSLTMVEEGKEACGEMGETLWHVASPMEKKERKVLAIDVEDFSTTQVPVRML